MLAFFLKFRHVRFPLYRNHSHTTGSTGECVLADTNKIVFNHGCRLCYCKEKRVKNVKCDTAVTFNCRTNLFHFILF